MAKTRNVDPLDPNPTVYNRVKRLELDCPHCPPNRKENASRKPKHGVKKPRKRK